MQDADQVLFPRFAAELVTTALKDTPVVMVTGPRQRGKTTLVRDLVASNREFITLDDDTVLACVLLIDELSPKAIQFSISLELQHRRRDSSGELATKDTR